MQFISVYLLILRKYYSFLSLRRGIFILTHTYSWLPIHISICIVVVVPRAVAILMRAPFISRCLSIYTPIYIRTYVYLLYYSLLTIHSFIHQQQQQHSTIRRLYSPHSPPESYYRERQPLSLWNPHAWGWSIRSSAAKANWIAPTIKAVGVWWAMDNNDSQHSNNLHRPINRSIQSFIQLIVRCV